MSPMKILLVDDSKSARYALRLQLQRHGAEVETADSAESALERVKQSPPDAVFMDHTMPGMNGFEALEILKADPETTHIPVVMCTSNEEPEFVAQARRKGALDILAKSATPEKLADLLTRLQEAVSAAPAAAAPAPSPTPVAAGSASLSAVSETASEVARQVAERFLAEQLEQRLEKMLEARLSALADTLKGEVLAQVDERIATRVEWETTRLRDNLADAQAEQTRAQTDRVLSDALPKMLQQQLAETLPTVVHERLRHEETGIAQMVQELIDASVDRLPEDPGFLRRMHQGEAVTAAVNTQETVRRHAREVAEETASGHAGVLAERLRKATGKSRSLSYLLASGAALIGIISAAVVYLLLRQ